MNRRQAVKRVAIILGGTVLGAEAFLHPGCTTVTTEKGNFFTNGEIDLLDEIAETIIPKTDTPGAKDAKLGQFMNVMVRDCYTEENQKIVSVGLKTIERLCREKNGKNFKNITLEQRTALLTAIDQEQAAYSRAKKPEGPPHYFRLMKELTLLGYFTSEPGATRTLRYVAVPGRYDPCIPYQKGERAWAL